MFNLFNFIEKNAVIAFMLVLVLGLIARLISFIVLPEATYTDAVFHLAIVKEMLITGSIATVQNILPMPLYHFFLYAFFSVTNLPLMMPFVRIIPFIISVLQIVFAYLLCKQLFPKNKSLQLIGVAFTATHIVVSIFSTVNYTGPIAALFVLISFYILLLIKNSESLNKSHLVLFIISVFMLSLTKINATITIPALLVGLFFVLKEKKVSLVKISAITSIVLILSVSWFLFSFVTTGNFFGFSSADVESITPDLFETNITFERAAFFYFNFWYFPQFSEFPKFGISDPVMILLFAGLFAVAILPLVLLIFKGVKNSLKEKNLILLTMLLSILLILPILVIRGFESRMIMPVLPLFGIFAAKGYSLLNNKTFRVLVILSFVFFGLFSFAYVSGSAYYFNSKYEKVSDFYSYISTLPDNSKILSTSEHRKISFYAGKEAHFIHSLNEFTGKSQFISASSKKGFSHFAVSCTDEYEMNADFINCLVDDNTLELIYNDECSSLYRINYELTEVEE